MNARAGTLLTMLLTTALGSARSPVAPVAEIAGERPGWRSPTRPPR